MIAIADNPTVRLTELVATDARVDEAGRRLLGVTLLGRHSRNGRVYSRASLRDVARLSEGAQVFANHSGKVRDVRDLIGVIANARVEGDRVRGDLRVLDEASWPKLKSIAQRAPHALGFSIDARGEFGPDKRTVARVLELNSVDLVTRPATTAGLFESEQWLEAEILDRWQSRGSGVVEHQRRRVDRVTDVSATVESADVELAERWKAGGRAGVILDQPQR